jgi:hypothetical protein
MAVLVLVLLGTSTVAALISTHTSSAEGLLFRKDSLFIIELDVAQVLKWNGLTPWPVPRSPIPPHSDPPHIPDVKEGLGYLT